MRRLTNAQAMRFVLLWHGLLGEHRFAGKPGALDFVRQSGCIQFDPVDVCGRNAELTLFSRVKGFTKQMLEALLYEDRALFDYTDKNQAIIPVEDWPYFARFRQESRESGRRFEGMDKLEAQARAYILENGPVDSAQLPIEGDIFWHSVIHWSGSWHGQSNAARSVLEQMYASGELVIHHKRGTRKVYDLAVRHIPEEILGAPDPLGDDFEHIKWRMLRRIGAVGLLWNRPSDAWLMIGGLDAAARNRAFAELEAEGRIIAVQVEGIKQPLYCRTEALALLERACSDEKFRARCEVIAPLDPMMWDRKLIHALFGFDYTWEIYTPAARRKYGYYVLPLIYGEGFVGRVEAVADEKRGALDVRRIWLEDSVKHTRKLHGAVHACMKRLARLNGLREAGYAQDEWKAE